MSLKLQTFKEVWQHGKVLPLCKACDQTISLPVSHSKQMIEVLSGINKASSIRAKLACVHLQVWRVKDVFGAYLIAGVCVSGGRGEGRDHYLFIGFVYALKWVSLHDTARRK